MESISYDLPSPIPHKVIPFFSELPPEDVRLSDPLWSSVQTRLRSGFQGAEHTSVVHENVIMGIFYAYDLDLVQLYICTKVAIDLCSAMLDQMLEEELEILIIRRIEYEELKTEFPEPLSISLRAIRQVMRLKQEIDEAFEKLFNEYIESGTEQVLPFEDPAIQYFAPQILSLEERLEEFHQIEIPHYQIRSVMLIGTIRLTYAYSMIRLFINIIPLRSELGWPMRTLANIIGQAGAQIFSRYTNREAQYSNINYYRHWSNWIRIWWNHCLRRLGATPKNLLTMTRS